MSETKATIVSLSIISLSVILTISILVTQKYKLFNEVPENGIFSYGTFEEAKEIVDKGLDNPTFDWLDDKHGAYQEGKVNIFFSEYGIQYNDVYMKLKFKDYLKYKKYLKSVYKEKKDVPLEIDNAPWR